MVIGSALPSFTLITFNKELSFLNLGFFLGVFYVSTPFHSPLFTATAIEYC
jgi:hypothetical protein